MKKLFSLFLLATLLFAQNPRVYSALGDVIYDNVDSIDKLKLIPEYKQDTQKIDNYTKDVRRVKRDGFAIDAGDGSVDKKNYLNELRELAKVYDSFIRSAKNSFFDSIESENSELFINIVNSGLIDTQTHKKDILNYYYKHCSLEISGVLQDIIDEDAKLNKRVKSNIKQEKESEKEKIKRIRQKDIAEQEAVKKLLDEEVKQKKQKIKENKTKELSGS